MKYCEEYAALLDLFVDGELPLGEMEQVQAHLAACPGCQAYVDDALAIRAGFPDVEDTLVPEGFAAGVMERVRENAGKGAKAVERGRRPVRSWAGTLAALAACCALMVLVGTIGQGGMGGSDSAAGIAIATSGADAPADCGGAGGAESAPQVEAATQDPSAGIPGEVQLESRAVAENGEDGVRGTGKSAEAYSGTVMTPAFSEEAACDGAAAGAGVEAALYLTAEEAGDLLDGYAPVWEDAAEWRYEVDAETYQALLAALGCPDEPEGEAFVVVVTRTLE